MDEIVQPSTLNLQEKRKEPSEYIDIITEHSKVVKVGLECQVFDCFVPEILMCCKISLTPQQVYSGLYHKKQVRRDE